MKTLIWSNIFLRSFKKLAIIALLLLFCYTPSIAAERQEYISPDGKFSALVIPLIDSQGRTGESKVEIRDIDGKLLCSKSYASEDGEHGSIVERAAWTADSQFFVYSLSSSGGHQAWHFPTDFISIRDFRVRRLDDYIGPITDSDFTLSPPDVVHVVCRRKEDLEEAHLEIRLRDLLSSR